MKARGRTQTGEHVIFKATYSGVPVYEFMCRGYHPFLPFPRQHPDLGNRKVTDAVRVPVMRRKSDSWMNATQILKVADFDKPQRTRILEREIQKGLHEKVQGGYGKYQG